MYEKKGENNEAQRGKIVAQGPTGSKWQGQDAQRLCSSPHSTWFLSVFRPPSTFPNAFLVAVVQPLSCIWLFATP